MTLEVNIRRNDEPKEYFIIKEELDLIKLLVNNFIDDMIINDHIKSSMGLETSLWDTISEACEDIFNEARLYEGYRVIDDFPYHTNFKLTFRKIEE